MSGACPNKQMIKRLDPIGQIVESLDPVKQMQRQSTLLKLDSNDVTRDFPLSTSSVAATPIFSSQILANLNS